jgi:hypothetical protein
MTPSDLLKVNVNDHTEKKNGLTYLSWAWAWAEALKADPKASFKVEMFEGIPLMPVGGSHMVWVTVTMFDKPMTCMLPVLDYRNKPIPTPNSFDVNTSIMRCLVKAIAMHGLGLYIYAGEDLPMEDDAPVEIKAATAAPAASIKPVDQQGEVKAEVKIDAGSADANSKLFADSMLHYTTLVKDSKALTSYWKSNQTQLDSLKVSHPDLYDQILKRFTELKKQFAEKKDE